MTDAHSLRLSRGRLALDVSNENAIDGDRLDAARPDVLIAKATEGTGFRDGLFSTHRRLAHERGIVFGSYLFLRVDSRGSEAAYYREFAAPKPGELPPIIDAEDLSRGADALADRAASCAAALERYGYGRPILYCSASVWPQLVARQPTLRALPVWEADYPGRFTRWTPKLAALRIRLQHGASVVLWQWTDAYAINGRGYDASRLFVDPASLVI